jgi:hypothetical protein
MGTLGKILLFVNLLVAAGLAGLIARDWAARRDAAALAARHQLTLDGLPVEAEPGSGDGVQLRIRTPGGHVVETVRPTLLAAHFQGADGGPAFGGGPPPRSQLEELQRVEQKVTAQLAAAEPAERLALLCGRFSQQRFTPGLLAAMAENYDERQMARQLAAASDPETVRRNVEAAETMLRRRFDAIKARPNPQLAAEEAARVKELADAVRAAEERARAANRRYAANPDDPAARQELEAALAGLTQALDAQKEHLSGLGTTAARDEHDRRKRIAHLLAHLDQDAAWQKRVALVVGLRTYLAAVQDQVTRLRDMAASVQQLMVQDQAAFSEMYEVLKTLASERALLLDRQAALTADLRAQRSRDQEAVRQRVEQLRRREQELASLQAQVAAALERQAGLEQELLALQRQVDDTQRRNFDLEQQLGQAERKAMGK